MFGEPTAAASDNAIFHLVWTYNIKAADGRKKARCVCDGSTRSGHVKILDETTKHYIKIDCHSYIDKFCSRYQWLEKALIDENRPTPLPTDPTWLKKFYAATGSSDAKDQAALAKRQTNANQLQSRRWRTNM